MERMEIEASLELTGVWRSVNPPATQAQAARVEIMIRSDIACRNQ